MTPPRLDIFPALLVTPTAIHRNVRVYAIDGENGTLPEVFVLDWDGSPQPALVLRQTWFTITPSSRRSRAWDVVLLSGEEWLVGRSGGCGCNSPLSAKKFDAAAYVAALLDA